jgi:hypothetical protein
MLSRGGEDPGQGRAAGESQRAYSALDDLDRLGFCALEDRVFKQRLGMGIQLNAGRGQCPLQVRPGQFADTQQEWLSAGRVPHERPIGSLNHAVQRTVMPLSDTAAYRSHGQDQQRAVRAGPAASG